MTDPFVIAKGEPGIPEPHLLVLIDKVAGTPASYPCKPGLPSQKPLM
jgi:hypothetical protein